MIAVKACIKIIVIPGCNATGNSNGHTGHVDEQVNLILHHASQGNQQVISKHGSVVSEGLAFA
jgi:hypothetical protein